MIETKISYLYNPLQLPQAKEPGELELMSLEVSPRVVFPQPVYKLLQSIADDLIFNLSPDYPDSEVVFTISPRAPFELISASERIRSIFRDTIFAQQFALPREQVQGLPERLIVPFHNPEIAAEAGDRVAIDMFGFLLAGMNIETAYKITMVVRRNITDHGINGITTGYFRFPPLLRVLSQRTNQRSVAVIGAGLLREDKAHSPQVAEVLALARKAYITVIELDHTVIKDLRKQTNDGFLWYDPVMLRYYTMMDTNCPQNYKPTIESVKQGLEALAKTSGDKAILGGFGSARFVQLKVLKNQVCYAHLDVLREDLTQFRNKFDTVVATMLLGHVEHDPVLIAKNLLKFLRMLKRGGSLFIDGAPFIFLGREATSKKMVDYFEQALGFKMGIVNHLLSDFDSKFQHEIGMVPTITLAQHKTGKGVRTISSSLIYELKRGEEIQKDPEAEEKLFKILEDGGE